MCHSFRRHAEAPFRTYPGRIRRWWLAVAVVLVAAAVSAALVVLPLIPSDLDQAEAELVKARVVVCAHEEDAVACGKDAKGHRVRAAEYRKDAGDHRDTSDVEWLEWHQAMADGHAQLARAKSDRRNTLTHLNATYLRLLAEAECEILRAKDARDRGTPYEVAPRVRAILAPVLGGR